MQTNLHRLESDDATIGGFLITYPSGQSKAVTWRTKSHINPVLEAAKEYAATALNERMNAGTLAAMQDADNTNWPSVVAAISRLIVEFNDRLPVDQGSLLKI